MLVAGVILSAIGDGLVIERPTLVLPAAQVSVIVAGPALYLLGHVLFRFRVAASMSWVRLGGAVACVVIAIAGFVLPAIALSGLLVGILALVIAGETLIRSGAPRPA